MHEVALAFFWHQHQPYYPDDVAGENPMPWVRLHGTKDYWGMAMLLKEVPELHATINLVPSLLQQLLAYTDGGHQDTHLRVSRLPADGLSEDDMYYLLDNFFMVHPDQMIRPYPRYHELYKKRGLVDRLGRAGPQTVQQEGHHRPAMLVEPGLDPPAGLRARRRAGRVPQQGPPLDGEGKAVAAGQADGAAPAGGAAAPRAAGARAGRTDDHALLPSDPAAVVGQAAGAPGDAQRRCCRSIWTATPRTPSEHIRRAVEFHEKLFGQKPRGMWPSEGSVCQAMIPAIAEAGIQWIATDEEILSCSTDGWVSRDGNGYLRNPEMLYRPWRVEEQGKPLQIVFRDHAMSDQIGFHYQRYAPEHAVNDFIGKLEAIGNATGGNAGHRPTLVSIILDGENCWEYYPNAASISCAACIAAWCSIRRSSRFASATIWPAIRPPTSSATSSPAVGSSTTSASGSAIPSATGPGTCCTRRGSIWSGVTAQKVEAGRENRPGLGRTVHRRGQRLVLVVRRQPQQRPGRAVRPACSASTCRTSTWCSASSRRPNWPGPSARDSATRRSTPSPPACCA